MINTREKVLGMLLEILEDGQPFHLVLARGLDGLADLDERDRSFAKKLCQGTVERKLTLDYYIGCLSKVKVEKLKPVIRNLLRMGIYQMAYMNVPDSAACNECVKIAVKRRLGSLSGYVNAVLRSFARERDRLTDLSSIKDPVRRMSVEYSMPEWLVRYWTERFGEEKAAESFSYFLSDKATSIRCNISKINPDELAKRLEGSGVRVEAGSFCPEAFRISDYGALKDLKEFTSGLFTVQDESSVLEGEAAGIRPGDRILDLCAAPGGKALNAADKLTALGRGGSVTACDVSEAKTELIRQALERMPFGNVSVEVNDARVFRPSFENAFDIVLADLPCSGLGIIGKKPDIKYNISPDKMKELAELQRQILDNAVRYVKAGGRLVYSTCTLNREENEDNVAYLTDKYGFKLITAGAPPMQDGVITLLPGEHGTDGFFIAVLGRPGI